MSTDSIYLKRESDSLIGCAIEVHNGVGYGLKEKPYENALVHEFDLQGIPFQQQRCFEVNYKGAVVGEFIPDLIAFNQIVVDTKVTESIGPNEIGQMMNYLKITKLKLGYIINFKHPRLQWKRVVL